MTHLNRNPGVVVSRHHHITVAAGETVAAVCEPRIALGCFFIAACTFNRPTPKLIAFNGRTGFDCGGWYQRDRLSTQREENRTDWRRFVVDGSPTRKVGTHGNLGALGALGRDCELGKGDV
mgnify:CR=1 FL=1